MLRQPLALLLLSLPLLSGCARTRLVRRTFPAPVVYESTLEQLNTTLASRYNAIHTMSATVELVAATGGGKTGEIKTYPSFTGYIFLRKPEDLRVLLLVPVLRSKAIDMVSDGKTFKLVIPPRNKAITGSNEVTTPSKNGLENLRPSVFFDSLLIQGPSKNQIVSRILDSRIVENPDKKALTDIPEYDVSILGQPDGQIIETDRVIHISRDTLLPYQQDIYDKTGRIVTRALYSNYQSYNDIQFPQKIVIERPLDEYSLTLTFTRITFNEPMEKDQFELKIPEGMPVQHMQ